MTNDCDAVWDSDTLQAFAFPEGLLSDTGKFTVFTESDACQGCAVPEGLKPDAGYRLTSDIFWNHQIS